MNRLDPTARAQVIRCLIDGGSARATVRITNVAKKTVMRLLCEVGEVCAGYQARVFRNLRCRRLQLDETWSRIYCRQKNRIEKIARERPDAGDICLWVCIDADTKLVPTWTFVRGILSLRVDSLRILQSGFGAAFKSQLTPSRCIWT